jgi:hypothetical protein
MTELQFHIVLLQAAIAHAKVNTHIHAERRGCALFYLQVVEKDYAKARNFTSAAYVRALRQRARNAPVLSSLLETFVAEERGCTQQNTGPACNTGPTKVRASTKVTIHDDPIASYQASLLEYFGGTHGV